MFNQSYEVHITPLVINSLGGGHTHKHTHTHTDVHTETLSRNHARGWFKNGNLRTNSVFEKKYFENV